MEAFVERSRHAIPRAVLTFRETAAIFEAHASALRFGCLDAKLHSALGINLGIFFARLVRRGGLPVIDGRSILGDDGLSAKQRAQHDEYGEFFHWFSRWGLEVEQIT